MKTHARRSRALAVALVASAILVVPLVSGCSKQQSDQEKAVCDALKKDIDDTLARLDDPRYITNADHVAKAQQRYKDAGC